jgi:hypothetical protein
MRWTSSDKLLPLTVKELVFNIEKDDTMVIRSARAETIAKVLIVAAVIFYGFIDSAFRSWFPALKS